MAYHVLLRGLMLPCEACVKILNIFYMWTYNYFHNMCWKYFVSLISFLHTFVTTRHPHLRGSVSWCAVFYSPLSDAVTLMPGLNASLMILFQGQISSLPVSLHWSQIIFSQQSCYFIQISSGSLSGFWYCLSHLTGRKWQLSPWVWNILCSYISLYLVTNIFSVSR